MNETIRQLMHHRSIRHFKERPVSRETLESVLRAAQMASTSSNMQAYSIIRVTDQGKKKRLSELAGHQVYVENCPCFLVWCADLYRLKTAAGLDRDKAYIGTTENLVVSLVDVALAAQNAVVAAESLGLGAVYIGGIRNEIEEVSRLLQLPELVMPVFGMCLGYPDQDPAIRPRLPYEAVVHENGYEPERMDRYVGEYDETMKQYMLNRSHGKRDTRWTGAMREKLSAPVRMQVKSYIRSQGFLRNDE
jgi:FMN reductase (NADPH)